MRGAYVFTRPEAEHLAEIARHIDAGRIRPVVSQVFPLREARRVLAQIQTRHTRGKLVLRVPE